MELQPEPDDSKVMSVSFMIIAKQTVLSKNKGKI